MTDKIITIDGEEYIARKKDNNNDFVIVRTYSAGVFAGNLIEHKETEVTLTNAIRLWKWAGAFTLSELAMNGTSNPQECKFAAPINKLILTQAIEIIYCTKKAEKSILGVKIYEV